MHHLPDKKEKLFANLGQYHNSISPVYISPNLSFMDIPNRRVMEGEMGVLPLAYGIHDIIRIENADLPEIMRLIGNVCINGKEEIGIEYIFSAQRASQQFIAPLHAMSRVRHGFESILAYSETLDPLPIEEDILYKRITALQTDKRCQEKYTFFNRELYPRSLPFESLILSGKNNNKEHIYQPLVELVGDLNDFEIICVQLKLCRCPDELFSRLEGLKERMSFSPLQKYADFQMRMHEAKDKLYSGVTLYFARLRFSGIALKVREQNRVDQIDALCSGIRYGNVVMKCVTHHDMIMRGASLMEQQMSVANRLHYNEGCILSDREVGDLMSPPNTAMLHALDKKAPIVRAHKVPRNSKTKNAYLIGMNPNDSRGLFIPFDETIPGIHLHGAPGSGKTSLLLNLIKQECERGDSDNSIP
jgi:hypothetical protein